MKLPNQVVGHNEVTNMIFRFEMAIEEQRPYPVDCALSRVVDWIRSMPNQDDNSLAHAIACNFIGDAGYTYAELLTRQRIDVGDEIMDYCREFYQSCLDQEKNNPNLN